MKWAIYVFAMIGFWFVASCVAALIFCWIKNRTDDGNR